MKKILCLCKARHEMPECVEGAIFDNTLDPLDIKGMEATVANALDGVTSLTLYVTGLTVACAAVIKHCANAGISLSLMHYDRETGNYYEQRIF